MQRRTASGKILKHVADRTVVSRDVNQEIDEKKTFGEWLADKVAEFGGSWTFIIHLRRVPGIVWAMINTIILLIGALRSLSLHLPQSAAVDAGGAAGADHHDVAEPAVGEGPRSPRSTTTR